MVQSFKARQMVAGRDTLSVMAMHYGLRPTQVRDIIRKAGVKVIREDGFQGKLAIIGKRNAIVVGLSPSVMGASRVHGWEDGMIGVDPATTKLTKPAIKAVSLWKHHQDEIGSDK